MAASGLLAQLVEMGAAGLVVADAAASPGDVPAGAVVLGVHRDGPRPLEPDARFDILLSADARAPAPWVALGRDGLEAAVEALRAAVERQPAAAAVAVQVVRASLEHPFDSALAMESLAFSMLLAAQGFKAWRAATPRRERPEPDRARVLITEEAGVLQLTLNRPERRNAVDAAMRDALCEALDFAAEHPDRPPVRLSGEGPDFSAGGDLDEFGTAPDPGEAHLVRLLRSPARRIRGLGDRLEARVHGACIGAGIEAPAAAHRLGARPDARFRLPEVSMGLIPGAGGTATIPRRIGRHRACYMAVSGVEVDAATALAWGLVDEVLT